MSADVENKQPSEPAYPHTHTLDLRRYIPPAPPRPHTRDFAHITLILNSVGRQILKQPKDTEIRIGRHGGEGEIRWNNIDLGVYEHSAHGISRRHCRIFFQDDQYMVEDLASTNGTWLNGTRLPPNKPTAIKTRDYVQIGQLGFWVFLPTVPEESTDASDPQNSS